MSDTEFAQFYTSFIQKNDNLQRYSINVNTYAIQKILFYAMQIDSKLYDIDLSAFSGRLDNFGNYIVYYRNNKAFIITKGGNIFVEIPTTERINKILEMEIYKIPKPQGFITEVNDDYILTSSGLVALRDKHDIFYELQYEGKVAEALKYAMDIFGVTE